MHAKAGKMCLPPIAPGYSREMNRAFAAILYCAWYDEEGLSQSRTCRIHGPVMMIMWRPDGRVGRGHTTTKEADE